MILSRKHVECFRPIGALMLLWCSVWAALLIEGCGNNVHMREIRRIDSVDGGIQAVLFTTEGDYGATAPTAYHVALVPKDDVPRSDRTVAVFDRIAEPNSIELEWHGNTLNIVLPVTRRLFKEERRLQVQGRQVAVVYSVRR